MRTHKSFCRFCHAVCGIEVDIEGNRAVAVRGDPDHPISKGYLCVKGRALLEQHEDPGRLRGALRRSADGSLVPVASERAMDEIATRLGTILERHGPSGVAVYSGTHGLFSSGKSAILAWVEAIGTPWYFTPNTIDQPSQMTGWARHGSWNAGPNRFVDAGVLMFVGNNPGVSAFSREGGPPYANAFGHLRDARRRGCKIIAIDPRRTELARVADLHLQVHPGEDPTLLAGILRVVLEEGLFDREFVAAHAGGVELLRDTLEPFTPEAVATRARVPAAQVVAAARMFAGARRGTALTCTGVNMAPRPDVTQHLVIALNSACGRFQRAGDPVHNPGVLLPARARYAEVEPPREIWGKGPRSRFRGLGRFGIEMPINVFADEILEPGPGQIRALICVGGNPAVAFPNQRRVLDALGALDLLVVLDVKRTATADLAQYVLGCKLSLEKPGTSRTAEIQLDVPFAQYTPALLEPGGDLIEEWEFFWGLAHRMRTPLSTERGGALDIDRKPTSDEYLEHIHTGSRVPLAEVKRHSGGAIFEPEVPQRVEPPRPEHAGARFDLAPAAVVRQLREIAAESFRGAEAGAGPEATDPFPFRLISRRMMEVYNSTGDHLPRLRRRFPYNPAFMHPDSLRRIGARPGEVVRLESDHDFIYGVAEQAEDLRPGVVSMAHARGGAPQLDRLVRSVGSTTNRLVPTDRHFEPISGIPRQSAIPVRVRPLTPDEHASIEHAHEAGPGPREG